MKTPFEKATKELCQSTKIQYFPNPSSSSYLKLETEVSPQKELKLHLKNKK